MGMIINPYRFSTVAHRYWRSYKTNGASGGSYHSELILKDGAGSAITVTSGFLSQSGLSLFSAANLLDGNLTNNGFHTDSAGIGSYLKVDFGAGNEQAVRSWIYNTNNTLSAIWDIQHSDDDSNWITDYTGLNTSGGAAAYTATW